MARGDLHQVEVAGSAARFAVREGERILAAARRVGVWLPFECGWGSCGTCKLTLVDGLVEALLKDAPSITPRDERRGRILACQSTALSDLVVKPTWISDVPREEFRTTDCSATLSDVEVLGPNIWRLRFHLDQPVAFREGQHAILDIGQDLRRCYSMANLSGSSELEFIAKRYEGRQGSERLLALAQGACVSIEMPYGEMWVRPGGEPIALVAGGTGIAPILAMLRQLAGSGSTRAVHVFFGANTRAELVCWDEIAGLVEQLPNATVVGTLAAPPPAWTGERGFVTDALRSKLPDLIDATFYVAGPPVMTDAVLALLRDNEVSLAQVHYDSFG